MSPSRRSHRLERAHPSHGRMLQGAAASSEHQPGRGDRARVMPGEHGGEQDASDLVLAEPRAALVLRLHEHLQEVVALTVRPAPLLDNLRDHHDQASARLVALAERRDWQMSVEECERRDTPLEIRVDSGKLLRHLLAKVAPNQAGRRGEVGDDLGVLVDIEHALFTPGLETTLHFARNDITVRAHAPVLQAGQKHPELLGHLRG